MLLLGQLPLLHSSGKLRRDQSSLTRDSHRCSINVEMNGHGRKLSLGACEENRRGMERTGLCAANNQDHMAQSQRVGNSCLCNCAAAPSGTVRKHDLRLRHKGKVAGILSLVNTWEGQERVRNWW